MAASTPVEDERYVFESQIRELYGRCAYTHKTHEKMAERASLWLKRTKWAQIILSALVTGGAIGVLFARDAPIFPIATAILSISLLILNSYVKDVDPGKDAQRHREAASDIWNVREGYLSLLTDVRDNNFGLAELRSRRDELQQQLHALYRAAPHTDGKAYGKAQDALKNNEDLTFTEAELDALLPTSLKRLRN